MEKLKPVKIAVMSFENGHCYWLYKGLQEQPMVEVVAVSFSPKTGVGMMNKMGEEAFSGVDKYYDDEEMLNAHPEIEACVCGGTNAEHIKEFRLCAERGIHIISMKVPTMDMEEYDEMLALQKKHNICVHIELEMRWKASIERMIEVMESGQIGELQSVIAYNYSHNPLLMNPWTDIPEQSYGKRVRIRPGSKNFRGGALTDHPHVFDLIRYMVKSEFDTVYAEAAPNMRDYAVTEDMVYIIAKMKNGVIVSIDPSYCNRENPNALSNNVNKYSTYPEGVMVGMQMNGSKGSILADNYQADYCERMWPADKDNRGDWYMVTGGGFAIDNQRPLFIRNFVRNIRLGDAYAPVLSLAEHKKTIQVMNAAYESIYTGKTIKVKYDEE